MKVIGLTGGIGMGKTTAALAFRRARIPVFDADATVHKLQARGGRAVRPIGAAFPGTTTYGAVNRAALRAVVFRAPEELRRLERIVHPLIHLEEALFLARARRAGRRAAVIDNPLLFEMGSDKLAGLVLVVSAPRDIQIHRLRKRGKMSRADIEAVIARQMPDAEKRRRAGLVIRTGLSRNHTLRPLRRLILGLLS
jgi:dephospho-CoA kinase